MTNQPAVWSQNLYVSTTQNTANYISMHTSFNNLLVNDNDLLRIGVMLASFYSNMRYGHLWFQLLKIRMDYRIYYALKYYLS